MPDFTLRAERSQEPVDADPFHQWSFPDGTLWTQFYRLEAEYLLRFPGLADFCISAGGETVACHPAPGVTTDTIEHLYYNQVLPLALSKQELTTFHASAIEMADGAVAFVGESGRGKSTLAASFATRGYRVLTDDGLILRIGSNRIDVLPGHPSIRLWQDSEDVLIGGEVEKAPPLPFTDKARIVAATALRFCTQPAPLVRAYFLGDGSASRIELHRLKAADALIEWAKNSFLLDVEESSLLARYFDQMALLSKSTECYLLDYPRSFDQLANVQEQITKRFPGDSSNES